jgi:hypothetical protein
VCAHVGNGRVEIGYKLLSGFYIPASYMYRFTRINRSEKFDGEMATRLKAIRGARGASLSLGVLPWVLRPLTIIVNRKPVKSLSSDWLACLPSR